jgi:hypothetical protein
LREYAVDNEPVVNSPGYVSRAMLQEQLAAERKAKDEMLARLERLEAAFKGPQPQDLATLARLRDAQDELAKLKPNAAAVASLPKGDPPKLVPYKGLVRATQNCAYECFRRGPEWGMNEKKEPFLIYDGDVFEVKLPALWSDDPFEPVKEVDGKFVRDTAIPVLDYRWRLRLHTEQALEARAV